MATAANILAFLRRRYPHPEPDPAWVTQCMSALVDDGQVANAESVHEQYIYSDLGLSTLPPAQGTSIPPETGQQIHDGVLFSTPTILQIHTVAEIGNSAFQLRTTLEQRRDIISGATHIRRLGDEDVDNDITGPPPYPRSMLAMDVSDGRTALRAIEYRRIPELVLGEAPLGTKLLLHKVRCLRGTLLLTPDNCTVLGGSIAELEDNQPAAFVSALEARLEAAKNGSAGGALPPPSKRRTLPVKRERKPKPPTSQVSVSVSSSHDARAARLAAIQAARNPPAVDLIDTTFEDDFDVDDSFIQHVEAAEAAARPTRKKSRISQVEIIEISD